MDATNSPRGVPTIYPATPAKMPGVANAGQPLAIASAGAVVAPNMAAFDAMISSGNDSRNRLLSLPETFFAMLDISEPKPNTNNPWISSRIITKANRIGAMLSNLMTSAPAAIAAKKTKAKKLGCCFLPL